MFTIRSARPEDTEVIFSLIQELAAFENLEEQVTEAPLNFKSICLVIAPMEMCSWPNSKTAS